MSFNSGLSFNDFANLYCCGVAVTLLLSQSEIRQFLARGPNHNTPPRVLDTFSVPFLTPAVFFPLTYLWCFLLILTLWKPISFVTIPLAIFLYFVIFARIWSLHFVIKKSSLIPCFLLLIFVYRISTEWMGLGVDGQAWLAAKAILASVYFGAGLSKIRVWARHRDYLESLRGHLAMTALLRNTRLAARVILHPTLCRMSFLAAILWEVTMPLVIVLPPQICLGYAAFGLMFHFGTLVLMRIDYLRFYWPGYMVFLTDFVTVFGSD